jgi:formylglycine-generating enzyme required for sulfatase activity
MVRAAFIFTLLLMPAVAHAEKRVALVVGNSAYQHAGTLANPLNDARDVAAALSGLGFQVILGTDLSKQALDLKVREFAHALEGADVGVFFYAGHGLQVKGINYLVATDAKLEAERDLDFESVKVDAVLTHMEREAKTNIVFLDACRNNPLARNLARTMGTRGVNENNGLAPVASALGTFIAFATQPGNVASDGAGRNSPFTTALKKHIAAPGVALSDLMIEVRREVVTTTKGAQVPWDHSALQGRFYFNITINVAPLPTAPVPTPALRLSEAAEAWDRTKDTSSIATLEFFVARYKDTYYAGLARLRIEELKKGAVAAPQSSPSPARCDGVEAQVGDERRCLKVGAGKTDWFKDCPNCPEMVVVPAGNFTMGSPKDEPGRVGEREEQVRVVIAKPFAVGRFAVTRAEFEAFVNAADYKTNGGCFIRSGTEWKHQPDRSWRSPGFAQDDRHPVTCVSWNDVNAYVVWLSKTTLKSYRLLSEAEREYAARAGTSTPFWWGSTISTSQANYDGNITYADGSKGESRTATVSVDSFAANAWGLYNVHGNVFDWMQDCWNASNSGNPGDGSARASGDCSIRVVRGGAWYAGPASARAATRGTSQNMQSNTRGFRIARSLD